MQFNSVGCSTAMFPYVSRCFPMFPAVFPFVSLLSLHLEFPGFPDFPGVEICLLVHVDNSIVFLICPEFPFASFDGPGPFPLMYIYWPLGPSQKKVSLFPLSSRALKGFAFHFALFPFEPQAPYVTCRSFHLLVVLPAFLSSQRLPVFTDDPSPLSLNPPTPASNSQGTYPSSVI